ncbi:cellulose binding domain-containing protein [Glycomyces tarimensis]
MWIRDRIREGGVPTDSPTDEPSTPPTGECEATVAVVSDWGSGWEGRVAVTAGGSGLDGWTLSWDWPGGQQISSAWNADWAQSGTTVSAASSSWNGRVEPGQTIEAGGFIASGTPATPQIACSAG